MVKARNSKPRNSYELMERAIANMEAHPETYLQEFFVIRGRKFLKERFGRERCDTAFCRAGHIVVAFDGALPDGDMDIRARATVLLGVSMNSPMNQSVHQLFSGGCLYDRNGLNSELGSDSDSPKFKDNPREYLWRGVAGMELFMERHKEALMNHSLDGL